MITELQLFHVCITPLAVFLTASWRTSTITDLSLYFRLVSVHFCLIFYSFILRLLYFIFILSVEKRCLFNMLEENSVWTDPEEEWLQVDLMVT